MPTNIRTSNKLRTVRNLLCASAAALALHACAGGPSSRVLTAADLLTAPYSLHGGEAFDVDAMFAALPAWLDVEHGGAAFDASLGAMVVTDLRFALTGEAGAGLRAQRAVIWGGDPAAMQAVFSGEASLTEMSQLFDRMSLENVTSEGMQWEAGTENASLTIDKMVIDGLMARSFALAPKGETAAGISVLRQLAAVVSSFAYDGAAYSGVSFGLNNSQGDNVEMKIAESFVRGYRSGDVDYQSSRGMSLLVEGFNSNPLVEVAGREQSDGRDAKNNPYAKILNKPSVEAVDEIIRHPAAFLASAIGNGALEYQIDVVEQRNVNVSQALSWLAKWELPPITETDLIDLGQQSMSGYREIWNGQPYYTLDSLEVTAADFYWLVPSQYEVTSTGVNLDMNIVMDQMRYQMGPGLTTEAQPQMAQVMEALSALGLEQIAGDMDFSWRWNGETGDAALSTTGDIIESFANSISVNMGGPSLVEWDVMARDETLAKDAVGAMTLQSLNFSVTDYGLVDRAFSYAAAQNGAGTGAELRQAVSGMVRLYGVQAAEMNPRFPGYAQALADFLDAGGTIAVDASPETPVELMAIQAASQVAPQTLPDILNISVTHDAVE